MSMQTGSIDADGLARTTDGKLYVMLASGAFTGALLAPDGSNGAPSYAFSGDATMGMYRVGANQLGFAVGGQQYGRLDSSGNFVIGGQLFIGAGAGLGTIDAIISRVAANSLRYGATSGATTTSRTEINKATAAIANAVATTVLTVTIPNAAHSASIEVRVTGSLGAGGAIGANEATATNTYVIGITRTAGVAAVATATAAFGAVAVAVAGAATVTATAALTAMSGAVGATQTFDIQVTISRSGGSSDNHTCLTYAKLLNANVTGITIA